MFNPFYIITPTTVWGNKKTKDQELRERQDQEELFARLMCEAQMREQQESMTTPSVGGIPFTQRFIRNDLPDMTVWSSGNRIGIKNTWNSTQDWVLDLYKIDNGGFNFQPDFNALRIYNNNTGSVFDSGSRIQGMSDDMTPINTLQFSYMTQGHGSLAISQLTSSNHGLTNADIGKTCRNGSAYFALLNVPNSNTINLITKPRSSGGITDLTTGYSGLLTMSVATINGSIPLPYDLSGSFKNPQIYPVIFNLTSSFTLDNIPINDGFSSVGKELKIISSYSVYDFRELYGIVTSSVGTSIDYTRVLPSFIDVTDTTRIYGWGGMTQQSDYIIRNKPIKFDKNSTPLQMSDIQTSGVYTNKILWIPMVTSSFVFSTPSVWSPGTTMLITQSAWLDLLQPPNFSVQFASPSTTLTSSTYGYAFAGAHDPLYENTSISNRANQTASHLIVNKVYPISLYSSQSYETGSSVSVRGWRSWFVPNPETLRVKTWAYMGDYWLLSLGWDNPSTMNVSLPLYLASMRCNVVEGSGLTLSSNVIDTDGILHCSFTTRNGYANVKLTPL